jgi:hypothetical protein
LTHKLSKTQLVPTTLPPTPGGIETDTVTPPKLNAAEARALRTVAVFLR